MTKSAFSPATSFRSPAARLPLTLCSPTALLIVSLVLPFRSPTAHPLLAYCSSYRQPRPSLPFACRSPSARLPLASRSPPPTLHLSAFRDAVTVASLSLLPYSDNRASPVILGYPIWKSAVAKWRQMGEWGFFLSSDCFPFLIGLVDHIHLIEFVGRTGRAHYNVVSIQSR